MNQELILETKRSLQEIFSTPCDQALLICLGSFSPIFIQGLKQNIQARQKVLVLDTHDSFDDFLKSCRSVLKNAEELRYRVIQANENEHSLTEKVKANISGVIKEITGKRYRTELQFHNFFMNIPELCTGHGIQKIKDIAKGKNVVVLGAGPSLKSSIPWLKENREKLFIVAAGSIANGLYENDIHPDIYVETDHRAPTHWEKINPENYNLVAASTITAGLAGRFKQVFWMESCSSHRDWIFELEKKFCPEVDRVKSPDQNTGLSAVGVAQYCGAKSITLIGIDLCLSPDGNSHSSFFHRGKDKVEVSRDMQYVKNNKGEMCPTIYGAFINGFNDLIAKCPKVQFIQTSENGVQLNNTVFQKLEDCELNEETISIPDFEKRFNFREVRPHFRELKKLFQSFNGVPENTVQEEFLELIKISSIMSGSTIEEEFRRQQEKYINYLGRFQDLLHEYQGNLESLGSEITEVGVQINWQKEYKLAGLEPDLETPVPTHWKLDWQRTHMMQLLIQKEGQWQPVSGQYEITEKAAELVNNHLRKQKSQFNKIICLGVWDGNYISLLVSKFSHCEFTIIEPDQNLLGKLLKYVPMASKLPPNTRWMQNADSLSKSDLENCMIICPDEAGEYFPEIAKLYKVIKSL